MPAMSKPVTAGADGTAIPRGYALWPIGPMWRPVLVLANGAGYRELSTDGRTGAVCATREAALQVIARHQVWRAQQAEMRRAAKRQAEKAKER